MNGMILFANWWMMYFCWRVCVCFEMFCWFVICDHFMSFLEISPPALEFFSIFSASADDMCSQKRGGWGAGGGATFLCHCACRCYATENSLPTSRNALDAVLLFSSLLTSPCTWDATLPNATSSLPTFADFHMHLMLLHQYACKFLFDFQFALASYDLLSHHFHSHRCYDTTSNLCKLWVFRTYEIEWRYSDIL